MDPPGTDKAFRMEPISHVKNGQQAMSESNMAIASLCWRSCLVRSLHLIHHSLRVSNIHAARQYSRGMV